MLDRTVVLQSRMNTRDGCMYGLMEQPGILPGFSLY